MSLPRLALLATVAAPFLQGQASAAPLLPHRAVYDLGLDDATDSSGITGLSGRMVYEFNGSGCEGYTVTFRFVTQIEANETTRLTDQQTTTFEAGDGSEFSFVTRSFIDRNLDKESRGSAQMTGDGTEVSIEMPEPQEHALEKSQFPTHHLIEVLEKANAGENFYETTIYDGSEDGDKLMTTTVILGQKTGLEEGDTESDAVEAIASEEFWPVDIAYFDLTDISGEETPTYRISMKLYDNGVTRDLTMDYGDFAITGRLVDLELFDEPGDCAE
ncbi:cell envelope integrity EipB family protein [Aliihoeflea sp. 2WW]|uniref:cell envelope integrity EipB family protein n=1 Tax=Aliihoeflea sp. 2WW TaxID=1381123 RepID=UPI000467C33E|nr:cell envelope integrity EipB family protein [Aliihoeflea sp. 2WW]